MLMKFLTAFLSLLPGTGTFARDPTCKAQLDSSHAMNQYGRWSIVHSNDPKVRLLRPPVYVDISPGSFRIPGSVSGSFRIEPESAHKRGVFVSMCPFSLSLLRETYNLVALDPDRMALFGTGRHESRYYILERARDRHGVVRDRGDADGGGGG